MDDGLKTLDEKTFKPPETRVGSAASVRSRIQEMKDADRTRSDRRAKMQGIINGHRPLNQQKLIANGQGDRTNLNDRSAEGMADAAKTPYYSLIFRVPRFANLHTCYGDQPQRRVEWSEIFSEEWHTMLDDWNGHDFVVQLKQWQMCVFGIGLPMYPDAVDWRWESRKISDVLVPDETPADIDKVDECVAFRWLSPVDLYQMVKNEKSAKTMGWFPDRVKRAIVNKATTDIRKRYGDTWSEDYQASLRRGDILWNSKGLRIPLADYLKKEFTGKITHVIMLDDGSVSDPSGILGDKDHSGLLFKKIGRYEDFSQVMCPFFFDIGTGEWHSIKGLGPKIYDFCAVSNILTSTMIDGALNSACMILQAETGNAQQETQLAHIHGAVVIQPGYQVQQNKLSDNLQGTLAVKRDLQMTLQSNIGQYRERISAENQEPTLGQAKLNAQNQASLNESAVDRYMKTLDRLYAEQMRRAFNPNLKESDPGGKEALAMRKRCLERGVPEEAMKPDQLKIKAARGIGSGSPVAMEMATQGLMALVPMMNEVGRNNAFRMRTSILVGQSNVDQFFPPIAEADVPDDNVWAASVENLVMSSGSTSAPPVTPKQDHVIHFKTHFQFTQAAVQTVQQGGNPMQVLMLLHQEGPHMKTHIDRMAGDPTREAQLRPMQEAWLMLSKITDQLQQQIEEAAKSQEANKQPELDPALITGLAKVQGELELKRTKMMGDMQLKKEKQDQTAMLKDLQLSHSIRLKNVETAHEMSQPQPAGVP